MLEAVEEEEDDENGDRMEVQRMNGASGGQSRQREGDGKESEIDALLALEEEEMDALVELHEASQRSPQLPPVLSSSQDPQTAMWMNEHPASDASRYGSDDEFERALAELSVEAMDVS